MVSLFPLPKVLPPSDGCGDGRETFLSWKMHVAHHTTVSVNVVPRPRSRTPCVGLCLHPLSSTTVTTTILGNLPELWPDFISTPLCYPNPTPELVIFHNYSGLEILKSNSCIKPDRLFQFPTIIIPVLQNYEKQLTSTQTTFKIMLILLPNSFFPS